MIRVRMNNTGFFICALQYYCLRGIKLIYN
jgi:hypothetical protein